jgi:hypothetical protein
MARKYIDDLGIKRKDTPQGWGHGDARQAQWREERKVYGFDERETWSLDLTFKLWLYERLMMYKEVNNVATSMVGLVYKGENITLQGAIDRMLEGIKLDLTVDEYSKERETVQDKIDDVLPLFLLSLRDLWW